MKRISLFIISFIFTFVFTVSAFSQTGGAQPAAGKIGLINTLAFGDEKAGVTKYRAARKSVEDQLLPISNDIKAKTSRLQALAKEIDDARKNPAIKPDSIQAKIDEAQNLEIQIKRMQEDGKAKYERLYSQIVGPVYNDILRASSEFAKQKGYAMILDGAKLEEAGLLMGFDEKYNVTTEFITFYNARPASTATTAVPR